MSGLSDSIERETEFQRRRVAAIERAIAGCDFDVTRFRELALTLEQGKAEYERTLSEEKSYLAWLDAGAPIDDEPDHTPEKE